MVITGDLAAALGVTTTQASSSPKWASSSRQQAFPCVPTVRQPRSESEMTHKLDLPDNVSCFLPKRPERYS